jgi:hypothetical protein
MNGTQAVSCAVFIQVRAGHGKERPQQADAVAITLGMNARQAIHTAAPRQSDQKRFCLVISVVRSEHRDRLCCASAVEQRLIAMHTRPGLDRLPAHWLASEVPQREPNAKLRRRGGAMPGKRIGCRLQAVVHMTSKHALGRNSLNAGMQQRSGIDAAAEGHHQRSPNRHRSQRTLNRLNNRLFRGHGTKALSSGRFP